MRRTDRSPRLGVLALALAAASAACASTGAIPKPFPMPSASSGVSAPPAPPVAGPVDPAYTPRPVPGLPPERAGKNPARGSGIDGYALAGAALSLRGIPYRNGGSDPNGFDCSGFTQYVFSQFGVALPRGVREQYQVGKSVKPEELAPGDIVFFSTTEPGPSHVAIAIGGDEFVHAPSSTGVVRVEHLGSSYWAPRFLAAKRLGN
jgi:cell wall-associated NlpC family hydrolase